MRIYIISGESSGDLHGANLISEILKQNQEIKIRAWGGNKMKEAGATIVKHINELAFMGFSQVILNLNSIKKNMDFCKKDILEYKPKALILIDYPGFNLKIAKFAKKNGIKVFYYISPKVWAWNKKRINSIRNYVDELVVIFPFEVDFFKKYGIHAHYFGNPIYEEINKVVAPIDIKTDKKIIALLPGSRKQEVYNHLPIMLKMTPLFPEYKFIIASVSDTHTICKRLSEKLEVDVINDNTYFILNSSKAAIVTSGTATLETALLNVPQLVCYKTDFITYSLAKLFINIKWISLVNIIMNKMVVKEFIQFRMTVANLQNELQYLLSNKGRDNIISDYKDLQKQLHSSNVSRKAAKFILKDLI